MDRRARELAERFADLNAAEAKNIAAIRSILNDLSRLIASTRMDPPEAGRRSLGGEALMCVWTGEVVAVG
jgi:hypothetical protein